MASAGDDVVWGSTLCTALNVLREETAFCDTTVVGNDQKTFRAHACVLAAASPTLKTYLKQATGNTYVLRVDHMSSCTWQNVLQFVYTGRVFVAPGSSVASLSKAANTLQMLGLQTALLAQSKRETPNAKKPVAGDNAVEESRGAFELKEECCGAETLPSADHDYPVVRRVTAKKTVTKRIRRLPDHDDKAQEAVNDNTGDNTPEAVNDTPGDNTPDAVNDTPNDNTPEAVNDTPGDNTPDAVNDTPYDNTPEAVNDTPGDNTPEAVNDTPGDNTPDAVNDTPNDNTPDAVNDTPGDNTSEAVNDTAGDDDIKSEHESDDSASETKVAKEVNKLVRNCAAKQEFLCNLCGKVLATKASLTRHILLHNENDRPFRCETCHMGFIAMHALRKHSRTHTGEKPYRCHVCGKSFSSSATLPYHMKIHSGEKPFVCDICEYAFRSTSALKVHRRTHTGEKPYPCGTCGRSFATANRRTRHVWTHEGRKPYHCDLCDKAYTSSTKLKVHRRIHTGERPFMCEVCGLLFSRQTAMNTHVAGHHKLLQRGLSVQSMAQEKV